MKKIKTKTRWHRLFGKLLEEFAYTHRHNRYNRHTLKGRNWPEHGHSHRSQYPKRAETKIWVEDAKPSHAIAVRWTDFHINFRL